MEKYCRFTGLIERSEQLLKFTIDGDEDQVINLVEAAHDTYSSVFTYNNENSLSCVITMAYFTAYAYYDINREFHSGKGFIDFVFVPMKLIFIYHYLMIKKK